MIKKNCISNQLINMGEHLAERFNGFFYPTDIDTDTNCFQVSKVIYHDLIDPTKKEKEPMDMYIDFVLLRNNTWEPVEAYYKLSEVGKQKETAIDPYVAYKLWLSQVKKDSIDLLEYLDSRGTKPDP